MCPFPFAFLSLSFPPCLHLFNSNTILRIEYHKKKGKTNSVDFIKDEATLAKVNSKEAHFKKNTIYCPNGLPPSSTIQKVRKNAVQVQVPTRPQPMAAKPKPPPAKKAAPAMQFPMPTSVPDIPAKPAGGPAKKFAPVAAGGSSSFLLKKPAAAPNQAPLPVPGALKPKPAGAKPMGAKPAPVAAAPNGAPPGGRPLPAAAGPGPALKPAPAPIVGKPAGAKPAPAPMVAKPGGAKPPGMKPAAKPAAGGPPQGRALPVAQPPKAQFKALYDYEAVELDELTFKEGDVITLTRKVDPEWWEGQLNGLIGMFPANYVEEIRR